LNEFDPYALMMKKLDNFNNLQKAC